MCKNWSKFICWSVIKLIAWSERRKAFARWLGSNFKTLIQFFLCAFFYVSRATNLTTPRSAPAGHCGHAYPHPQGQASCPARGSQCRSCWKINHFARYCRSKSIGPSFAESSPPALNRVFNDPLLTPYHVNPLHLNNTLSLRMSIFYSQ